MWHEMRHTREERSCPKSIHEYLRVCGVFVREGQFKGVQVAPNSCWLHQIRVLFKVIIAAFENPGKSSAVFTAMKVCQKLSKHVPVHSVAAEMAPPI